MEWLVTFEHSVVFKSMMWQWSWCDRWVPVTTPVAAFETVTTNTVYNKTDFSFHRPNIETFMLTVICLWNYSRSAFIDLSSAAPAHLDAAGGGLLLLKLVCYPPIYAEDVGEDEQVQHCDVTLVASNCCSEVERWLKTTKPNMSLPLCLDIWIILTPRCRNYKMGS